METFDFKFDIEKFNRIFPFYLLIDKQLQIKSFGKSFLKICPLITTEVFFAEKFAITRPHLENFTFEQLSEGNNQLYIIQWKASKLSLRGQFEIMGNHLLFVGSPWFTSMNEVIEKNLTIKDFAYHDPLLDMLHILNNSENISKELKEILETVNSQKNKLKKDKEELNRLSLVASANKNGVVFTYPNGRIFWCNEAYLDLTGYTKDEILGKTPIEIGRTKHISTTEIEKLIVPFYKGEVFDVDLIHGRKDGSFFWAHSKGQPIFDKNGTVLQYFAVIEDISQKKEQENLLKIEKEKYRNIIANMNLGLLEVDENDIITLVNQSFCEISGFSKQEIIGQNASKLLLTDESKKIVKEKEILRKQGINDSYEVKILDKNKKLKTWLISGAPNYNEEGKVVGSIGVHLDITEQKEQEERLFLLSLIAEKNINAVVITDAEGKIEWANSSFLNMSGFSMTEIIGKKPGSFLQGEDTNPDTINYMKDCISKGLPFDCEIINYKKTGEKYWISIKGQALYDKKGKITKFFAIEEDITQKKALEKQREELVKSLARSNQELEDYASIVSHDLKSPLRSIYSLISWIKEDNEKQLNELTTEYLSMIENKVEKMDYLIEGILTYSKISKVEIVTERVNTQELIENIINIIYIPNHISVTIKNQLPIIKADKFRIHQMFQNLISNAVNYMDKPIGKVEVSCKITEKEYVFAIKDNGPGIAKENQEKIFQIFHSLENTNKSTGIGLSIVKKIVDTYKGEIWIESQLDAGTTFYVKLPIKI